jgi:protein tyrosine/serine phosphatase
VVCGAAALEAPAVLENVHAVVPGVVYRSAQLDPEDLTALIRRDGIRSILNLRGAEPGASWYDGELAVSERAGVRHVDFELSAVRDVPGPQADRLVALMEELPKPLLIHCQAGADRSGLAAALYRYAVVHDTSSAAASQLSVWYGHVPFLHGGTAAMDQSYWAYVHSHPRRRAVLDAEGAR